LAILYVTEQGSSLRKKGRRIVVEKFGKVIQWTHAFNLDQIIIMGNIQLTPSIISFLLSQGIDTVFLSIHGKYRGRLISGFSKNIVLRRAQFLRFEDQNFALNLSKKYVYGKLFNCRVLLRRYNNELKDERIADMIHKLRVMEKRTYNAKSLDELRGIEGKGTASYFGGFKYLFKVDDIRFEKRTRRPPRDPINVLLSLGYTLLANLIQTAVYTVGMDPFLGCLHAMEYGRPSLTLDLMEEFRPVLVDSLVIRVINRRWITPYDFYIPDGRSTLSDDEELEDPSPEDYPIILTAEGMKKFITHFENRLSERVFYIPLDKRLRYRDICLEQARMLARHLKGEENYQPYQIR